MMCPRCEPCLSQTMSLQCVGQGLMNTKKKIPAQSKCPVKKLHKSRTKTKDRASIITCYKFLECNQKKKRSKLHKFSLVADGLFHVSMKEKLSGKMCLHLQPKDTGEGKLCMKITMLVNQNYGRHNTCHPPTCTFLW